MNAMSSIGADAWPETRAFCVLTTGAGRADPDDRACRNSDCVHIGRSTIAIGVRDKIRGVRCERHPTAVPADHRARASAVAARSCVIRAENGRDTKLAITEDDLLGRIFAASWYQPAA